MEMQCYKIPFVLLLLILPQSTPAWKVDVVKAWARTLGDELWHLSEALTKSDQIRIKYKQMNASVKEKDGKQILESSLRSVSTMLTRKIYAVKCIHATAEKLAMNFNDSMLDDSDFEYCSAKYSNFINEDGVPVVRSDIPKFAENNSNYMTVTMEKDSHFYDINVNTNISCVHVPTNIFYKEKDVLAAILWSKNLNDIFIRNYQSDPSLVWQYFGSAHGILRFYPGMPWNTREVDTYDCRVMSWYIEAATCSKDVIILFDVSGSMTGFKNYVARRTLRSLLDTLSNNDYVNVYTFKNLTSEVVQCFVGLVQATPENLATIVDALEPTDEGRKQKVPLEGNANLTTAYIQAFTTLKERRTNCSVDSNQGCNQLVMVITDYVPGNLTEVFEEYNREVVNNKTYIPVRVFTYLIGKEVTNVLEIQSMACNNRGYYVHIHSVEEVQQQVLKYINVIARPMILAGDEPPPTWTHANVDYTRTTTWNVSKDVSKPDEDKLVASVAIPAFDYTAKNDSVLLGVAGTDVPIDSIAKLAQPHQLGVNGYSFIVSNNGYLLLHPLLITSINGKMQKNYNSVDFVEVEQVDDGKKARELGEEIKRLREDLVNGTNGSQMGIKVLYHYDNMRRIARVQHDYFYNKLEGTPFSMGISLPRGYGNTELLLKDNPLEAKQGAALTGINVTDYFRFSYRVHPEWVYCKYHYLEGHESENAEIEIFNFLVNISKKEIDITRKQYTDETEEIQFNVDTHCGNGTLLGKDDYYCNEDLVKQLVFDAKLSAPYYEKWYASQSDWELAQTYNVSVRFIATASGLTRWHYIFNDTMNEKVNSNGTREKKYDGKVFGDYYYNAIEETWYKAAVLQHIINKDSLVISTPLPNLDSTIKDAPAVKDKNGDIVVTASYAIFYKDGDSETPASVVGFQFAYPNLYDRFFNITGSNQNSNTDISCDNVGDYACYVIDSSGYVVIAQNETIVGKFFGTLEPYVLQYFVDAKIFDHVEVFNYQALCPTLLNTINRSWFLNTPFSLVSNFLQWLLAEAFVMISQLYNWDYYSYTVQAEDEEPPTIEPPMEKNETNTAKEEETLFSCDHHITLYILNQSYFLETMGVSPVVYQDNAGDCYPPFWASYIPYTNLLLVVVEKGHEPLDENCTTSPNTDPVPTTDSITSREPCHKLDLGRLPRRRLEGCYTYNEKERNITACGRGSIIQMKGIFLITVVLFSMARTLSPLSL